MNRNTLVELTNMCMIYDDNGNVLVEAKRLDPLVLENMLVLHLHIA